MVREQLLADILNRLERLLQGHVSGEYPDTSAPIGMRCVGQGGGYFGPRFVYYCFFLILSLGVVFFFFFFSPFFHSILFFPFLSDTSMAGLMKRYRPFDILTGNRVEVRPKSRESTEGA